MNKPRRAKSRRILPLPLDANETKCGICLDDVKKRGKIGPCSHLYCFTCLLEWSKLNNTCPQCKLTFRCISRIDFETDKLEEKVFIKDKTLKTGIVSSDDEVYINSSEIEDSDPDFIVHDDIPDQQSQESASEPEAQFTQRKRKCEKSPRKKLTKRRSRAVFSSSESDSGDENDEVHQQIISNCCQSPDLFEKSPQQPGGSVRTECGIKDNLKSPKSSRYNCTFNSTFGNNSSNGRQSFCSENNASPKSAKGTILSSPKISKFKSPDRTQRIYISPKSYLVSPKYSKNARWASLDQRVKNLKRKRSKKVVNRKSTSVSIKTLSPTGKANTWLSTSTRDLLKDKENIQPNKSSVNGQFKVPFKKKTSSPEKLFDDPEQYFASIINSET